MYWERGHSMAKKEVSKHSQYFFIGSIIIIFLVSLFLIKSYVITIIYGCVLSYIFYPVYKKIMFLVRNNNIASLLTTLVVLVIIIVPLLFVANTLINESLEVFQKVKEMNINIFDDNVKEYLGENIDLNEQLKGMLNDLSLSVAKSTSDIIISLPGKALRVFVMLFIMFYLFKEGNFVVQKVMSHIPLKISHQHNITKKFSNVIYASLYGIVVTAFLQGLLAGIGFWVFDVPSPILWGAIMVILSMIPFVGAWVIWLPTALYKIFAGDVFNGVGLLIYGVLIVSTIDNIVRPKIVGSKAKIHPVVVLLGVLGGLEVFGLLGIVIGPLILAILGVFVELYLLERTKHAHTKI